jgi:outer membrane murein-binding lipoprotein Lpp
MKYLPYLLIIVLSYFICNQHNEIQTLNSKINALDYKTDNLKKKDFPTVEQDYKETFYLTQLSNSTTLVLSVIGFALILAGVSSYILIKERFEIFDAQTKQKVDNVSSEIKSLRISNNNTIDAFRNEISVKLSEYEKSYKDIEKHIYEIRNDLNYEISNSKYNQAKEYYNENKIYPFVFYSLLGISVNTDIYKYYNEQNNKMLAQSNLDLIKSTLDLFLRDLLNLLDKNTETITIEQKGTIIRLIENINNTNDNYVFDTLSKVYNSLKFQKN